MFAKVNVADFEAVETAVEEAAETFGTINSLVVSAGIQRYGTAVSTDEDAVERSFGRQSKRRVERRASHHSVFAKSGRRNDCQCFERAGVGEPAECSGLHGQQTRAFGIDALDGDGFCERKYSRQLRLSGNG